MQNIKAEPLNIEQLLANKKYTLSYFQREYNWEKENIEELIKDLTDEFSIYQDNSIPENSDGNNPFYFLGSIIVNGENGSLSLIDGQQRLTSLCLILIYIARTYEKLRDEVLSLVYDDIGGVISYTIHAPDRTQIMNYLCKNEEINIDNSNISVQNIKECYKHVENSFSKQVLSDDEMESFVKWLKRNVYLAEIRTHSPEDGYKIFESANDRGLNLSHVDMLKSYLLSEIEDEKEQKRLDVIWKKQIDKIKNAKESDSDAIKCWLRATRADSLDDFEKIGSEFHKWIRGKVKNKSIKLETSNDFIKFIEHDFTFYTDLYLKLREMAKTYSVENESIFCNQYNQFSLQYPVILSTINRTDDYEVISKKIKLLTAFIDIFIARHYWSGEAPSVNQRRSKVPMTEIITKIRGKELRNIASDLLENIDDYPDFYLNNAPRNSRIARQFLARFSSWLDRKMNISDDSLPLYLKGKRYTIEHIMPNKYDDYYKDVVDDHLSQPEFENESDFHHARDKIGALVLLLASDNISFNDMQYEDKLKHYLKQNMILAKTLNKDFYDRNPGLNRIINDDNIRFEGHDKFLNDEIKKRTRVYIKMAEIIWSRNRIKEIADL